MNLKRIHFFPDTKIAGMLIGLINVAAAVGCADLQSTDLMALICPVRIRKTPMPHW
jgi:hypothetical protein